MFPSAAFKFQLKADGNLSESLAPFAPEAMTKLEVGALGTFQESSSHPRCMKRLMRNASAKLHARRHVSAFAFIGVIRNFAELSTVG